METFTPEIEVRPIQKHDLWQVRELALQIFPVTYQDIVPQEQISYMMDMFYTQENLVKQFDEGQNSLVIYFQGVRAGFASFSPLQSATDFKLNKIYLDQRLQGKGLGKWLILDVMYRVKRAGGNHLILNVNKNNKAVGFYQAMGFLKIKDELLDIGHGYYMDDHVMGISLQ